MNVMTWSSPILFVGGGRLKVAQLDQIARVRVYEVSEPERPPNVAATGTVDACWKKLKPGKFAFFFWIRNNNNTAYPTVMEIVNVKENIWGS